MLHEWRIKAYLRVMYKVLLSTFSQQTEEKCCGLASRGPGLARGTENLGWGPLHQAEPKIRERQTAKSERETSEGKSTQKQIHLKQFLSIHKHFVCPPFFKGVFA